MSDVEFPIFEASDSAKKLVAYRKPRTKYDFPFDKLEVGQSFPVKFDQAASAYIRNFSSKEGKRTGKVFAVISHAEQKTYEVTRVS